MIVQEQQVKAATMHQRRHSHYLHQQQQEQQHPTAKSHHTKLDEICSMEVKWENACRGQWFEDNSNMSQDSTSQRIPHYKLLSVFKNVLRTTYNELKSNTSGIDIRDTNTTWLANKRAYQFLPRLRRNSKLALRTWHHRAQIYAASFNYLRRAELYFGYNYTGETDLSRTLKKFEQAALLILCEIEATINKTSRSHRKLHHISPAKMQQKLKFRTEMKYFFNPDCQKDIRNSNGNGMALPANSIDLRFIKKQFLSFLRSMRKIVNQKIKTKSSISSSSISSGSRSRSESNSMIDSLYDSSTSDLSINSISTELSIKRREKKTRNRSDMRRHHKNSNASTYP